MNFSSPALLFTFYRCGNGCSTHKCLMNSSLFFSSFSSLTFHWVLVPSWHPTFLRVSGLFSAVCILRFTAAAFPLCTFCQVLCATSHIVCFLSWFLLCTFFSDIEHSIHIVFKVILSWVIILHCIPLILVNEFVTYVILTCLWLPLYVHFMLCMQIDDLSNLLKCHSIITSSSCFWRTWLWGTCWAWTLHG